MRLHRVLETCLCVADLAAAERFYGEILGLEFHARQEGRHVFFRCGEQMFLLFDPRESSQPGDIPSHGTTGAGHVCFAAQEAELDAWKGRLERHGISIERDYRWPGGGRSLYFRDPDGNCIEIATPRIWGLPEESPEERSNRGWDS